MNYEFNMLPHVGVVAKRRRAAAAAHEGDDNGPGVKNAICALLHIFSFIMFISQKIQKMTNRFNVERTWYLNWFAAALNCHKTGIILEYIKRKQWRHWQWLLSFQVSSYCGLPLQDAIPD